MLDKVKVGIVGLGRINTLHLEAYKEKTKIEVNPQEARKISQIGLVIIRLVRNNFQEIKVNDVLDKP